MGERCIRRTFPQACWLLHDFSDKCEGFLKVYFRLLLKDKQETLGDGPYSFLMTPFLLRGFIQRKVPKQCQNRVKEEPTVQTIPDKGRGSVPEGLAQVEFCAIRH
jgi:hypothetical protein